MDLHLATILDYATLEEVAKDGAMEYNKWPGILEPLLQRLSENHTSTNTDLETIPDQIIGQLTSIQDTLRSCFAEKPPHTIQRLAELVISPKRHYKTLPAWLRAVDRVVSVSSTADIFPLPHAQPLPNSIIDSGLINGLVNGDSGGGPLHGNGAGGILWNNSAIDNGLGSDESLGGALLTPIPWLANRENGDAVGSPELGLLGSNANDEMLVPEREDGAVTQGELIRMEQEAGIVPVSQGRSSVRGTTDEGDGLGEEEADEIGPHARGPDVVGVEDMGLQDGNNLELQLGRGVGETESDTSAAVAISEPIQTQTTKTLDIDAEGDVVLADAEGTAECPSNLKE
ncbi:hypothetical protein UCRPC4_g00726 [Phaeomoniella chlamydospora]|uniref:Uncharacterized protein n=1 Tax=Phaeomoniella chlamydospora TaxID=158046 RepID=A0A0G2F123_PHACM|nr:hypothetical protein UCRPC4_g00726 [Phaeomoniella chlamydospora]